MGRRDSGDTRRLHQIAHQVPWIYAQGILAADLDAVYDATVDPQRLDRRRGHGQRAQNLQRALGPH